MLGCPLLQFGQSFYVDFGTGTSADNIYTVTSFSHKITPGDFSTSAKLIMNVGAYGLYNSQKYRVELMTSYLTKDYGLGKYTKSKGGKSGSTYNQSVGSTNSNLPPYVPYSTQAVIAAFADSLSRNFDSYTFYSDDWGSSRVSDPYPFLSIDPYTSSTIRDSSLSSFAKSRRARSAVKFKYVDDQVTTAISLETITFDQDGNITFKRQKMFEAGSVYNYSQLVYAMSGGYLSIKNKDKDELNGA
jgi:hypothetical protein